MSEFFVAERTNKVMGMTFIDTETLSLTKQITRKKVQAVDDSSPAYSSLNPFHKIIPVKLIPIN